MKIIGLNSGEYNSSACFIEDGNIKFAIQEERLNRQKFTKKFPTLSIKKILRNRNLKLSDIDYIGVGWNPSLHMNLFNPLISENRTFRENNLYTISDNLFNLTNREFGNYTLVKHDNKKFPDIYHINHHISHASTAFYLSNLKEAAILTCDFRGENQCTTWGIGKNNKIKILQSQNMPNSLGLMYATYTSLLGFKPDSDEWKVMAMSAYNVDCENYIKKIKSTYSLKKNGILELNQKYYFNFYQEGVENHLYTNELLKLLNRSSTTYKATQNKDDIKIAKALQVCAEEILVHFLNHLFKITNCKNVVLGGGFFMNSVFNGKIETKTKFKNSYISFAPTDTGNSIGSALYIYHDIKNRPRKAINSTALLGSSFKNKDILKSLKRRDIKYLKLKNFAKTVSIECAKGSVVAYFRNKMEFGDRALGCRSIIADPRFLETKDKINKSVKYRESFRPFAPSVIFEECSKYFNVRKGYTYNYMERVVKVKSQYRQKLEAITHLDNSARVHTVEKKDNPDFHKILKEFQKITTFPILLNTSFNINGEPIVCTPDDAISTFYNSKIDVLVIGDYMVKKI